MLADLGRHVAYTGRAAAFARLREVVRVEFAADA